jgi:hypothetical protein
VARCRHHCLCLPLGARSGECGGWVMCGSVRYVTPLPQSRPQGLMVHRTAGVKEFRELFDCPSYDMIHAQFFFVTSACLSFRSVQAGLCFCPFPRHRVFVTRNPALCLSASLIFVLKTPVFTCLLFLLLVKLS